MKKLLLLVFTLLLTTPSFAQEPAALGKKRQNVIMVRVTDKKGSVIYSG